MIFCLISPCFSSEYFASSEKRSSRGYLHTGLRLYASGSQSYLVSIYETFQYKPFDFVRKGRYHADLKRVLLRAIQELSKETDLFTFRSGNVSVRLSFSEITHIESEGNYVKIYTCDNSYSYRSTMKEMQERFETQGFVRIHKGFLVNCKAVHLLHTDNVTLENGIQLPIGRAWADNAKQQIMRSFR